MSRSLRWTTSDLELLPEDGHRYEVIEGELYVAKQPHAYHQAICIGLGSAVHQWSRQTGRGLTFSAPGVIFAEDSGVAPDLAWMSHERLAIALDEQGHLRAAPELVVEILSPGPTNEQRDREAKLKLYAARGVLEYWIVDWRLRQIEVYRHAGLGLDLVGTLHESDTLTSPNLPGFSHPVAEVFADIPRDAM